MAIIARKRSIIPACDVSSLDELDELVGATADVEGIGGYKIGFGLALGYGLPAVCERIRKQTSLPIIYDHQKAGTDTPHTAGLFAEACKDAGVDAVILFPQAGPESEKAWIAASREAGLGVIVGGEMTHPGYLETEGGWLRKDAPERIYKVAAGMGVKDFVVPGNRPERIRFYVDILKGAKPVFYSPGLITQGGELSEAAKAAGESWHAIVGRAIYKAGDMKKAATELASQL